MKKKLALFCSFVMMIASLTACGTTTENLGDDNNQQNKNAAVPTAAWDGKDLSVCVGPNPDTIDPVLNSSVDGATLIIHAFEGLYSLDKEGVSQPAQAESYELSKDLKTYTFKLRDGLKWSDGSDLTAKDFVYSWQRAVDPATASDYSYMFECIAGYTEVQESGDVTKLQVSAPDDNTLVVTLIAPTAYFLELTAFPTYSPVQKATIDKNGEKWAIQPDSYICNGPYMMTEWVPSSYIKYVKNPNYRDTAAIGPDSITFQLMEDDTAILSAFQSGDIYFADQMPNDEIDAWKDKAEFNLADQLGTYYVSFQTQKAPLDNPKIRQALTLAIDREWICTNVGKSGQVPAGAFVPPALFDKDPSKSFRDVGGDYYDPTDYEGNVEKAKKLLEEAGYPNGEGLPTIEYLYNEGTGHQQIGEALQNMWSKIGVKVDLVSQEWATFLNTRKDGNYYIARNGWLGDYNDPISFLDMWITGGGNNDAQWSNDEYDSLIKEIKSTDDAALRFKDMHKAEDIIFDNWMLCPIYYYVDLYLQNTAIDNVWGSPLGFKYFMYATPAAK